jgi:hypothetical protein
LAANSGRFQSFNRIESVTVREEYLMPRDRNSSRSNNSRGNSSRSSSSGSSNRDDSWSGSVMEMARERPIAAAAAAAGAAAAGLFLWSKRSQISRQLSDLSDQIGESTENMTSGDGSSSTMDDTAGLTTSGGRGRNRGSSGPRGMSETGGGNASAGAHSGGIGTTSTGSPSGRGRARSAPMPS